jgi:uncharacterized protein (TIGR00369 family)
MQLDLSIAINHSPQNYALGAYHFAHGHHADGRGWVQVALPYAAHLIGYPDTGVIAGGAIYTVMDTASAMAVSISQGPDLFEPTGTIDLRIDYIKPATPQRTVMAFSECIKLTRRIGFVRGLAYHEPVDANDLRAGRAHPIAVVSGTFMRQPFSARKML